MGWSIRLLEQTDEPAFVPFLGRRISDRSVDKHFNWLYRRNPHGDALTWIAVRDDTREIIGCTSTFPRLLKIGGKDVLASKGGDAYVDPEFRRQGIAQSLHEQSVADMKRLGIVCNFGIAPVPANFRAFMRAGALSPGKFDHFRLPLDASWIAHRLRTGWIRSVAKSLLNPVVRWYTEHRGIRRKTSRERIQVVDAFDARIDRLFDSVSHVFSICGKRDSSYLNWRFASHPFNKYTMLECISRDKLFGYAVLDMQTDRCKVIDFLTLDDEVGSCFFLKSLIKFAHDHDKRSMSLFLNPTGPYASLFERCGFLRAGDDLPMMVLTIGSTELDKVFSEKENWYLTPGDQDAT